LDLNLTLGFLGLEIPVVEREEDRVFLHPVTGIHGQRFDASTDLRTHINQFRRSNLTRRGDRKVDVARGNDRSRGPGKLPCVLFLPRLPELDLVRPFSAGVVTASAKHAEND
jgi:hypothetical protein